MALMWRTCAWTRRQTQHASEINKEKKSIINIEATDSLDMLSTRLQLRHDHSSFASPKVLLRCKTSLSLHWLPPSQLSSKIKRNVDPECWKVTMSPIRVTWLFRLRSHASVGPRYRCSIPRLLHRLVHNALWWQPCPGSILASFLDGGWKWRHVVHLYTRCRNESINIWFIFWIFRRSSERNQMTQNMS